MTKPVQKSFFLACLTIKAIGAAAQLMSKPKLMKDTTPALWAIPQGG